MLYYCKKCGQQLVLDKNDDGLCNICNSKMYPVPKKYLLIWEGELDEDSIDLDLEPQFIEECVKSSPEYDPKWAEKCKYHHEHMWDEVDKVHAIGSAIRAGADPKLAFKNGGQNLPKCPTCGSLNVKKIGGVERAASVGLFGLFSKKIGKTFECKNCGMMF